MRTVRQLGWGLLLLACAGSRPGAAPRTGTSGPAVLLIGLDGFQPRYLDRPSSHRLRELAGEGVRAKWMVSVFPTVTFPNFYSIATGLYPEHHGIVSNTMEDSVLGRFTLRDTAVSHDPRWWGGEPIWATAVKQGKRSACFFWPGSDVAIGGVRPSYYKAYDPRVPNGERVRQVLDWLSLPPEQAPAFVTVYFNDVDDAGHRFGPDAVETDSAIARVDSAVGAIADGLKARGLEGRVNLIVVSDHGMAELEPGQLIYLDDRVSESEARTVDLGPVASLIPRRGAEAAIYQRLTGVPHLKVYRRSDLPADYHYRDNPRIPPIIAITDEGWAVTTHASLASRGGQSLRGVHGYPPNLPSMRAIFLARGPAFRKGVVDEPFQNIHVYNLVAHILGLRPAANDGSLDSTSATLVPGR